MVREIFSLHTGHLWSCNVTIVVLFSANPHLSLISSISDEFDEEESVDLVSLELRVEREIPLIVVVLLVLDSVSLSRSSLRENLRRL